MRAALCFVVGLNVAACGGRTNLYGGREEAPSEHPASPSVPPPDTTPPDVQPPTVTPPDLGGPAVDASSFDVPSDCDSWLQVELYDLPEFPGAPQAVRCAGYTRPRVAEDCPNDAIHCAQTLCYIGANDECPPGRVCSSSEERRGECHDIACNCLSGDVYCPLPQLTCEQYLPKQGCTCDKTRPKGREDCAHPAQFQCDVHVPDIGCTCDGVLPPDPLACAGVEAGLQRSGYLGAAVGGDDCHNYLLPLSSRELRAEQVDWIDRTAPQPHLGLCPEPEFLFSDAALYSELQNVDACTCSALGGFAMVGHVPGKGPRYVGCAESPANGDVAARPEGWCATTIDFTGDGTCAHFDVAWAPVGWVLSACSSCSPSEE